MSVSLEVYVDKKEAELDCLVDLAAVDERLKLAVSRIVEYEVPLTEEILDRFLSIYESFDKVDQYSKKF